jgi:DNA mismatch repair protein MSH4
MASSMSPVKTSKRSRPMCFLSLTLIKVPPVRHIWLTSGQFDLAINLKFEEQRGYYMLTKKTDLQKRQLPSVFTNVSPQSSNLQYDSLELCKKNAKLRHSLNEIYVLSFDTIMKLIDDVRVYIGCLYKVCEGIAMLDMVTPLLDED